MDFTNKVILLTGGTSGAGKSMTKLLAESGCKLIITYNRSEDVALKLQAETGCDCVYLDQSDIASLEPFVKGLVEKYGHLDGAILNAGIYPAKKIDHMSEADWDRMMDVNSKGTFFLNKYLAQAGVASIVNISSINATNPSISLTHYGASKASVEFITKALAYNYGPQTRVNCIAPGLIYKEGMDQWIPGWKDSYEERSALHRLVNGDDVGKAAMFFLSDYASGVTGQTLTVDCGVSLAPYFYNEVGDEDGK